MSQSSDSPASSHVSPAVVLRSPSPHSAGEQSASQSSDSPASSQSHFACREVQESIAAFAGEQSASQSSDLRHRHRFRLP